MPTTRPQWPHTVEDIVKALDGVWGVVGALDVNGNLLRLERSISAPVSYTLTEYEGNCETALSRPRRIRKSKSKPYLIYLPVDLDSVIISLARY